MNPEDSRTSVEIIADEERAEDFFTKLRALCVEFKCTLYPEGRDMVRVTFENEKRHYETYVLCYVADSSCGRVLRYRAARDMRTIGDKEKKTK